MEGRGGEGEEDKRKEGRKEGGGRGREGGREGGEGEKGGGRGSKKKHNFCSTESHTPQLFTW